MKAPVRFYLRSGRNPNATDSRSRTLLLLAAAAGHTDICRLLIESGADPTLRDADGNDALSAAIRNRHAEAAGVLQACLARLASPPAPSVDQARTDGDSSGIGSLPENVAYDPNGDDQILDPDDWEEQPDAPPPPDAAALRASTRELQPRWIVIENVVHMRNWGGFGELLAEAEGLGYHVHAQVLDASTFGVPQKRRRLFLICDREEMPTPVTPPGGTPRSVKSDVVMWDGPWRSSRLYGTGRADATIEKAERAIDALGRGTPFLIVYYGSDGAGGWQTIDAPLRTVTTIDRFGLVTWVGNVPMLRMLQPPEIQRAMGFGNEYRLPYGSRRDRIRLLGNAVCPPVMTAVVTSVLQDRGASARRAA